MSLIHLLSSFAAVSAQTCVDIVAPDQCYIGIDNCKECPTAINCAGKCVNHYGISCATQQGYMAACGGGGSTGGGSTATCVDTAAPDECYIGPDQCKECEIASKCAGKCVSAHGFTCEQVQQWAVCGSSGGGSSGVTIGECTRQTGGVDFDGYQLVLNPARDGSITQSGDMITVLSPRATPSWCVDTSVTPPQAGDVMSWSDYYHQVGLHKLACVGWTPESHKKSTDTNGGCQNYDNAEAKKVYDFDAFAQSVGYFPDFAAFDSLELSIMDISAFLAHSAKETTGYYGTQVMADHAWCWLNEVYCHQGGCPHYGVQGTAQECTAAMGYPAWGSTVGYVAGPYQGVPNTNWNTGYYGRGALQLSYCYNYHFFTNWVENQLKIPKTPETDFFNNPGFVATRDWAFAAGLWFYMSPSSDGNKPSMHSVVDSWSTGGLVYDTVGRRPSDIGFQTNILNGGVECDPATASAQGKEYATRRMENLNNYLNRLNCPGGTNGDYMHLPQLATAGCDGAKSLSGANAFIGWYVRDWECSGDSLNTCIDDPICPWGGKQGSTIAPSETTTTTTTKYCPPFDSSCRGTTTTASVTTTTRASTTTVASVTTTTTRAPASGSHCCVRSQFLGAAQACHSITAETTCGNNVHCAWSDACVNHVHSGDTELPTSGPEMKCCTKIGSISDHTSCTGATESACGSSCVWTSATDCIDHVHF